jgi:hypothetical protein
MDLNELMKNPEQIQNLIQVLQALLPKETESQAVVPDEEAEYRPEAVMQTKSKKRSREASGIPNKFEKMSEFSMHKEDIAIDKALSKSPPVARTRDFEMIEVSCRVCGKKETISPALLFEAPSRYKCNNCSTQSG